MLISPYDDDSIIGLSGIELLRDPVHRGGFRPERSRSSDRLRSIGGSHGSGRQYYPLAVDRSFVQPLKRARRLLAAHR